MEGEYAEARSTAWRYRPLGSRIGVLQLAGERLSYTEGGRVVFDAPLEEIEVLGWPSAGGLVPNSQVQLKVGGKNHRICFVRPSNCEDPTPPDSEIVMPATRRVEHLARPASSSELGKRLGAAWRELLGG